MKTVSLLFVIFMSVFAGCTKAEQQNKTSGSGCFKGILVKKGICGQYVIKVLTEDKQGLNFAATWTDESSAKTFTNVFTAENFCSFPSSASEGDEISFKVTTVKENACIVCQAFTPVPAEKNSVIVSSDCTGVRN